MGMHEGKAAWRWEGGDSVKLRPSLKGPKNLKALVVEAVLGEVTAGRVRATERLPSERELAEQLHVSRTTVTAAYAELEQRGVIRRMQGKGAFVCAPETGAEGAAPFSWSSTISRRANALDEPVLELLARRCAERLPYPLSAGTPSLEVFPLESYRAAMTRVMGEQLPGCLAVAPTEGQWRLREAIGAWAGAETQNVMVLAGAQEGIDLLARCLLDAGDSVVVDSPTYPGAIQSFRSAGARLLPWGTAWSLRELEGLFLRHRPKLLFTMPTFHNPTGRVMSLRTRLGLLELAQRYRVPVVEDDVYGRTRFAGQAVPASLYGLDTHGQVISISTFSKLLAPGLRIGWLLAPRYMVKQLSLIKMRSNLFTAGLNQMVLAEMIENGTMDEHLDRLRAQHALLCAAAVEALRPAVEAGLLRFQVPAGSLYLWLEVLPALPVELLLERLERDGLSVTPGVVFDPELREAMSGWLRVCFSAATAERVAEGLRLLGRVLADFAGRTEQLEQRVMAGRGDDARA